MRNQKLIEMFLQPGIVGNQFTKWKAKEKSKDMPIWMQSSKD